MLIPRDSHLDRSWEIASDLLQGRLTIADLERQVVSAAEPALQARSNALLRQLSSTSEEQIERTVRATLRRLAEREGERVPFEQYRRVLESELAGIVVTAHPTFALSAPATEAAMSRIAAGMNGGHPGAAEDDGGPAPKVHRDVAPSLDDELAASMRAIRNIRGALRRVLRIAIDVAAELYPGEHGELDVRLLTVATWVGFDLDGRTDIDWSKSLGCRYALALAGLAELRAGVDAACAAHAGAHRAAEALELVQQALDTLAECLALGRETLGRDTAAGPRLGRLNRLAIEKQAVKRDAVGAIDSAFATLLKAPLSDGLRRDVAVLAAEWRGFGIGLARVHFRVNSVQLHNAIRPEISMLRSPDMSGSRRLYLAEISRLLDDVEPVNVHYGTVARERTTAKRVFMLAAQFRKHFDERTRIRLLIAESDTPFTLLVALYYARLFGVEDHIEISPLFETADGLHHGDRVISEVLDNPHFVAYLRRQGRFCIQLGFSDSGRYIGQPAASLAIERFKLRLVRLWSERELDEVQLLFFDTFGESIGRGAHPGGLTQRFLYTHSREVRERLARLRAPYKHEVSFQGGEGYLWFASETTAFAVVADLLATRLDPGGAERDALYVQSGWSLDFFLTLQDFQRRLTEHPGYIELINAIGRHLLYPTGSRPLKRHSAGGQPAGTDTIGDLRAIPNNAVLHQLGYLANSCAGIGRAANQAPDTFLSVLDGSDRLQRVLALALTARERSDITMLEAYVQLTTAGYWLDRSSEGLDRDWKGRLRRVSRVVEETFDQNRMQSFVRTLRHDAAQLDDVLDEEHSSGAWSSDGAWSSADAMTTLHVLRLALIQVIYVKAMEIPRFSPRLEISPAALVERLARLDVPETVSLLREIFPVAIEADDPDVYAEQDTYSRTGPAGYAAEHEQIFDPIAQAHALILEISGLVALHVGAYG